MLESRSVVWRYTTEVRQLHIFPLPITIEHSMPFGYVTVQSDPPQRFVHTPVNAT